MLQLMRTINFSSLMLVNTIFLSGCASTWSTAETSNLSSAAVPSVVVSPSSILIIEDDVTDRGYVSLGDISVTVNKTTLLNEDPTKETVNASLQEEAAKLGADAVIFVRYGTVGVSLFSWGSLEGRGRAIAFNR